MNIHKVRTFLSLIEHIYLKLFMSLKQSTKNKLFLILKVLVSPSSEKAENYMAFYKIIWTLIFNSLKNYRALKHTAKQT